MSLELHSSTPESLFPEIFAFLGQLCDETLVGSEFWSFWSIEAQSHVLEGLSFQSINNWSLTAADCWWRWDWNLQRHRLSSSLLLDLVLWQTWGARPRPVIRVARRFPRSHIRGAHRPVPVASQDVAAPHCKLSDPASMLQCYPLPAVLCGYAVNCGSCDGDSGLRRTAPMPAQLHAQRWSGWSCARETSTTSGPVTSSVCLPPAQQTTRLPGNLSQLRSGSQVNDIPLSVLTSCSPSQRKPSYKTGSCEQSYAIACLLSNVAPPKHSLPPKL